MIAEKMKGMVANIVYISASQYCISNTAVTQIELFKSRSFFIS